MTALNPRRNDWLLYVTVFLLVIQLLVPVIHQANQSPAIASGYDSQSQLVNDNATSAPVHDPTDCDLCRTFNSKKSYLSLELPFALGLPGAVSAILALEATHPNTTVFRRGFLSRAPPL